jgi:hypothetical protein
LYIQSDGLVLLQEISDFWPIHERDGLVVIVNLWLSADLYPLKIRPADRRRRNNL